MGSTQSKPKLRRSRRFSSLRKRQAPEGSNAPEPIPNEAGEPCKRGDHGVNKSESSGGLEQNCKFCHNTEKFHEALHVGTPKVSDTRRCGLDKSACFQDIFATYSGFKVDLPPTSDHLHRSTALSKCRTLPDFSKAPPPYEDPKSSEKVEDEWTITLYEIDKLSGRVPREDMAHLVSSIYDAVDSKIDESPHGRKTVRVRLSITPEPRHSTKTFQKSPLAKDSPILPRERSTCHCPNCPRTEPPTRRTNENSSIRRHRSDIPPARLHQENIYRGRTLDQRQDRSARCVDSQFRSPSGNGENADRIRHYADLEGVHNGEVKPLTRTSNRNESINKQRRKPDVLQKTPKPNKHYGNEVKEVQKTEKATATKRRARHNGLDHRDVMLRTRRKDPRFASPYDQHFQEAMYIRLRELQRQGTLEARRATGVSVDGDEADEEESDLENSGKKQVNAEEGKQEKTVEIAAQKDKNAVSPRTSCDASHSVTDANSQKVTNVHHHYHYHHGISPGSVLSAICSDESGTCKPGPEKSLGAAQRQLPPKQDHSSPTPQSDSSNELHHHHYHHHYHHTNS